jgi:hypothetical protein
MTDNPSQMKIADYAPVLMFLLSFFVVHLFDWRDASYFVVSVLVSLLTYNYEVFLLKQEFVINKENKKRMTFHSGLLMLMFFLVFAVAFLDWYRIIAVSWRMGLLYFVVVIYMAILFRVVNTLFYIRVKSSKK